MRYRVEVPYRAAYAMPTICVACGAPAPALTWEVRHVGLSVGGGPIGGQITTHTATLAFPVCGPCHQAGHVETTDAAKGWRPALLLAGAATVGLFLVRASLPTPWLALVGGVVVLIVARAVLRAARTPKPTPAIIEQGRRVEEAVRIHAVDEDGTFVHHRNRNVTVDFAREDAAHQFALANDGTLTPL